MYIYIYNIYIHIYIYIPYNLYMCDIPMIFPSLHRWPGGGILELSLPTGDTFLSKLARKFITEVAARPSHEWGKKNLTNIVTHG